VRVNPAGSLSVDTASVGFKAGRSAIADQGSLVRIALEDSGGLTVENASGGAGEDIPLKIKIGAYDAEKYSFLMLRGLPAEFNLSAGFRLKDRWAVSLRDLANLTLTPPAGYQGTVKLEVMLVRGQDKPVEHHEMTVQIGKAGKAKKVAVTEPETKPTVARPAAPNDTTAALAPSVAPDLGRAPAEAPKPARPAPAAKPQAVSPEEENAMLRRASKILDEGDVASARLLLEHIARKGSGKGALALAQTYDPDFLRSLNTLGLRPNPEKAREWYAVAADLGEESARERLTSLSAR
jgi:hypothetical protein